MTATAVLKPALVDATASSECRSDDPRAVLSFPPFRLDLFEERLWKGEREVQLRRKPFAILRYLAQRPRRLVTYPEIVEAVWGGATAMSESLLRTHMHDLRRALGEVVIETVVGRGYRFMAAVNGADRGSPGMRFGGSSPRGRHLEIVGPSTPRGVDPVVTVTRSPGDARARMIELADAAAALGLALAKRIVEQAGGRITLESPQGVGTVVSVVLPAIRNDG
jgi:DNA-binding winged helix-turn-helix (wHTH) protein